MAYNSELASVYKRLREFETKLKNSDIDSPSQIDEIKSSFLNLFSDITIKAAVATYHL